MASSIASALPQPKYQRYEAPSEPPPPTTNVSKAIVSTKCPPHGARRKAGWVPRSIEDYEDGGAFPEIHVPQFPLDMGRTKGTSSTLAVEVDSTGKVKYDALVRAGRSDKDKVYSTAQDLVPYQSKPGASEDDLARPDEEAVAKEVAATKEALEKKVNNKIAATHTAESALLASGGTRKPAQYIKYTPQQQGAGFNSGASQRIIRMVEAPIDPLEPPKFKHKKVPKGPPSPPVPVMHSPPRKLSVADQQAWKIPPCISNWKNAKGYTIPLDKRLAADGRGLQEVQINDHFATLSEALYVAERQAREEVEKRASIQKKMIQKDKEEQERKLRSLAHQARMERGGLGDKPVGAGGVKHSRSDSDSDSDEPAAKRPKASDSFDNPLTAGTDEAAQARDELREERRRQRERERRLARAGPAIRDAERDVSEKIALGQAQPTKSVEAMYDARLFNQSSGMNSGFSAEGDTYDVYDKPLFADRKGTDAYRPRKGLEQEGDDGAEARLPKPDRAFQGASTTGNVRENKPVEFEKDDDDPFGLNTFMQDAKADKKEGSGKFTSRGAMAAHGGGGSSREDLQAGGSGRSNIGFQRGSH